VSLNMCIDELALRLAPERVVSVTWLSRDPVNSNVPSIAATKPVNHGLAEEIIPLNPDLVLAGTFTTRTAVAMLKATRFPLVEFGIPRDIPDIRAQIRQMAALLDTRDRGEALIAELDRRAVPASPATRPTALVFNPNGFTVGAGTLVDDIMTRAGLDNIAVRLNLGNYAQIPLEILVRNAPDLLIVSSSRDGPPSLATEILKHPVLSQLGARTAIVVLPSRLWSCAGPEVVDAIDLLRAAAAKLRNAP
jgi:iron complex transport system substrate-binding protein